MSLADSTGTTLAQPTPSTDPDRDGAGRTPRGPRTRPVSRRAREDSRAGLVLISPTLAVVLAVVVLPILVTIVLAFRDLRLVQLRRSGPFDDLTLGNFREVLTSEGFWSALVTTLVYSTLGTASAIGLGLVAALALRGRFRGRGFVRAAMLLPYVTPVVAATFVWSTMLNPQFGIVNALGTDWLPWWDDPVAFLSQRTAEISLFGLEVPVPVALLTVIAFEMWRSFPFAFLFLTARMQAMPRELEEAARVDGATPSQRFRRVLLPQLMPTIALLALLRFIWTFNNFDDIYLLTGGGVGTEVVSVRVFNYLTARGDVGTASAQALVLALVLIVLVSLYFRSSAAKAELR